ncbi:helix-turn-helix domain-containing protein [Sphingomonas desiccabilis]|uniref:Transcriptional regulator n=1 Tax=Sphingomonas desiccabilis TaxID=429134 RepID=A0A4Q2IUI0_9SPHN|nr:helix-turn-helix transcriptional regulator [Sphingomonas desiccabilis]MBB3909582.1 putative transcriptional regulator [Sphingomonas desiccabilis]RXZ34299.1 transcriptional regulator [Sphingomonas desiccabilis]
MPVLVTLDAMLATRSMTGKELASRIGISETQLSLFKSGKVRGIRFATIAKMCAVLECAPGDLLAYRFDPADLQGSDES